MNPWHSRALTLGDDRWGTIEDYVVGLGDAPLVCIVGFPDGSGGWWPYGQQGRATKNIEDARLAAERYLWSADHIWPALERRKANP